MIQRAKNRLFTYRLRAELFTLRVKNALFNNKGMGTVEVILIIVVLIGLVIVFKDKITEVVEDIFEKITTKTDSF